MDTDGIYFVPPAVAASLWEAPGTVKKALVALEKQKFDSVTTSPFSPSGRELQ